MGDSNEVDDWTQNLFGDIYSGEFFAAEERGIIENLRMNVRSEDLIPGDVITGWGVFVSRHLYAEWELICFIHPVRGGVEAYVPYDDFEWTILRPQWTASPVNMEVEKERLETTLEVLKGV